MEEEKNEVLCKTQEKVEELIDYINSNELDRENVDLLYKLIDIHKDISNENYWETKKEEITMRLRGYNREYGHYDTEPMYYGRRMRDSKGRYMNNGYERNKRYRGEEYLDEMYDNYRGYSEHKEDYNRGNYGAKGNTMQSLEYMLQSVVDFVDMLQEEANSQEELELIKKYTRKISEM